MRGPHDTRPPSTEHLRTTGTIPSVGRREEAFLPTPFLTEAGHSRPGTMNRGPPTSGGSFVMSFSPARQAFSLSAATTNVIEKELGVGVSGTSHSLLVKSTAPVHIERALAHIFASAHDASASRSGAVPPQRVLEIHQLSPEALIRLGATQDAVPKLHRLLYTHTVGFAGSLKETLRPCAESHELMRVIVRAYQHLARLVLQETFSAEILTLADRASQQAALLHARLEQITDANHDLATLERALASATSANAEEAARNQALSGEVTRLANLVAEMDRRYATVMHQYVTEAQHRADIQEELLEIRKQRQGVIDSTAAAELKQREAEQALADYRASVADDLRRLPEVQAENAEMKAKLEGYEEKISVLSTVNERSIWRQSVTHNRFKEEMTDRATERERMLEAEQNVTHLMRELEDERVKTRDQAKQLVQNEVDRIAQEGLLKARLADIAQLEKVIYDKSESIKTLEAKLERKRGKKHAYKEKVASLNEDILVEQLQRRKLEESRAPERAELAGARAVREGLQDKITSLQMNAGKVLSGFVYMTRSASKYRTANRIAREANRAHKEIIETITVKHMAAEKEIKALQTELEKKTVDRNEIQEAYALLKTKFAATDHDYVDLKNLNESLALQNAELSVQTKSLIQEVEDAKGKVAVAEEMETRVIEAEQKTNEVEHTYRDKVNELERELLSLQGRYRNMELEVKSLRDQAVARKERVAELTDQLAGMTTQQEEASAQVKVLEGQTASQRDQIASLTEQRDAHEVTIAALHEGMERKRVEMHDLREQMEAAATRATKMHDELYASYIKVQGEYEAERSRGLEASTRFQELAKHQQQEVDDIRTLNHQNEGRVKDLLDRVESQNEALRQVRHKLDLDKLTVAKANEEKVFYQTQVESMQKSNAQLRDRLIAAEDHNRQVEEDIAQTRRDLKEQQLAINKRIMDRVLEERGIWAHKLATRNEEWMEVMTEATSELEKREIADKRMYKYFKGLEMSYSKVGDIICVAESHVKKVLEQAQPLDSAKRAPIQEAGMSAKSTLADAERYLKEVEQETDRAREQRLADNLAELAAKYKKMLEEKRAIMDAEDAEAAKNAPS